MRSWTRRKFLKTAAASTTFPLFTVAGTQASGRVLGANETINIGVAGVNGRGKSHISEFCKIAGVRVSHVIDPDTRLFDSISGRVESLSQQRPKCVADVRTALDDKDLDAVSVATCNHWHSLITFWACQAGKDVYVEKPLSHNVYEGRQCARAAAKYGCIVQHGTQQRSSAGRARQMAAIQSGNYGKLLVSKGYCCKPRWSIGFKPNSPPPTGFDFDLWLGPAPEQPFHGNLHPYNWHWFWDFGNGDMGNQGVHEMDVARWAIAGGTLPNRVWSVGGRYVPGGEDQGQTPNMLLSVFEFGDTLIVFETRGLVAKEGAPPRKVANEFYTTEGVIKGNEFFPNNGGKPQKLELPEATVTPGGAFGSFITAVRARDPKLVNGDAEVGHYSAALCHLGNISYRLGQSASWSEKPPMLNQHEQVAESFNMIRENLKMVDIPLDSISCQLGRVLDFDPKTERFVNDEEANALLTRTYRPPYVVSETV